MQQYKDLRFLTLQNIGCHDYQLPVQPSVEVDFCLYVLVQVTDICLSYGDNKISIA